MCAPELFEASKEAVEGIVDRNVVIAGYDDLRLRQPVEKRPRFAEFCGARPHREVAGDHEHVRLDGADRGNQGFDRGRVHPPEMDIGEMDEDAAHAGTRTRSARGRMR